MACAVAAAGSSTTKISWDPGDTRLGTFSKSDSPSHHFTNMPGRPPWFIQDILNFFQNPPPAIKAAVQCSGFTPLFNLPTIACGVFKDVTKIVGPNTPWGRAKKVCSLILRADATAYSVTSTLDVLEKFRLISDQVLQYMPIVNIVSYSLGFLSLGLGVASLVSLSQLWDGLRKLDRTLQEARGDDESVAAALQFLEALKKKKIPSLEKKLSLSKETKLSDLIDRLSEKIQQQEYRPEALDQVKNISTVLVSRSKVHRDLRIVDVAMKVFSIIGLSFLLFAPDPICKSLGFVIMSLASLVLLGISIWKFFFLNKNPLGNTRVTEATETLDAAKKFFWNFLEWVQKVYAQFVVLLHRYCPQWCFEGVSRLKI